ncbi:G-type lectin S-receptor-like serine/threonine-protein kinase At2g19130 isoform X2 [Panicum virgatum]|nr:G-type lectin S-receptor-like serine/threonine-protein kinase At2g19130 isoform X2 [Panicum virgatum]KAG2566181.1 hypothetical protein PVAP13_7NG208200 [Panicum virgatum]
MELGLAGVIQMLWNSSVPYWSSGDWNGQYQYFSSVPVMAARHLFDFTFVDDGREVSFAYHLRNGTDDVYSFLDVSGQRKVLLWQESTQEWITIFRHPELRCDVHAACGPFAVCDDNAASPSPCSCLRGFSMAAPGDWELGDRTAGCKRDVPLDCGGGGGNGSAAGPADRFYAVAAVRLPYDPRSVGGPAVTSAAECEQACLSTCSCSAYSFGTGGCSVWHGGLINVRHMQPADAAAGSGEVLHLRLAAKEFQTRKKLRGMVIGGAIAIGIVALGVSVLVLLLMVMARRNRRHRSHCDGGLIAFRYRDLQRATGDFSDKIGAGGFGSVFKGSLNTSTIIAVKRLYGSYQAEKQFRAEVGSIGILQHTNLVKMVGFCCERDRRLLVYEHMPNLSLDAHLFRSSDAAAALSWGTRYRVALGVARGLAYLHESCRDCVIHCDVKPQNILLDGSFCPKIADFGMAKLMARDLSRVLTTARGTVGYLAPEWISGMPVTPKVDVYAYGMVLLEIVSGRMNSEEECGCGGGGEDDDEVVYFPVLVARKLVEGDVMSLVDRRLGGDAVVEEVERACKVACWCIQDNEADRPAMGKVVQMLEGLVQVDMPPTPRLLAAIAGRSHSACT